MNKTIKTSFERHLDECPQILKKYLNYIRVIKGRSNNTVKNYYYSLRTFFSYMFWRKGLSDIILNENEVDLSLIDCNFLNSITYNEILEYLAYCTDELKYSATSRSFSVSAIKQYYSYMIKNYDGIINNPALDLEKPKLSKKEPVYLNVEEATELLNTIANDVENPFYLRDYCIITLFLNCAMRISELVGINFKDIKGEELRIHGKGNKERIIILNEACLDAIKNYLRVRPVDGVKDKDALFLSKQLSRINPRTIQYMLEKYIKKIGLDGLGYSPHKLRHTAATLMYQSGETDSRTLQGILGHENLNTTEIYTHINQKQVKAAVNSNPLSKIRADNKDV